MAESPLITSHNFYLFNVHRRLIPGGQETLNAPLIFLSPLLCLRWQLLNIDTASSFQDLLFLRLAVHHHLLHLLVVARPRLPTEVLDESFLLNHLLGIGRVGGRLFGQK